MAYFKSKIVLILFLIIAICQGHRFTRLLYLPIDPNLVQRANFQTSLFLMTLNLYNIKAKYINLDHLQIQGLQIQKTFQQLDAFLARINNLVMGYNNKVSGTGQRILVDNVVVKGNGGWVLQKNFNGNTNGDLIMGDYQIDLHHLTDIKTKFHQVIKYIGK